MVHFSGKGRLIKHEIQGSRSSASQNAKLGAQDSYINSQTNLETGGQSKKPTQSHIEGKLNIRSVYCRAAPSNSPDFQSRGYT